MRRELLTIGRFANLTDLSPKVLRKLDERGLLSPAFVDPDTHYRYYDHRQLRPANIIRLCRQFQLPSAEIRDLVRSDDPHALRVRLERHRTRVTRRIAEQAAILDLLEQELSRSDVPLAYEIGIKDVPPVLTAAAWGETQRRYPHDPLGLEREIQRVYDTIEARVEEQGVTISAPPIILYHTAPQEGESVLFEVCCPISGPVEGGDGVECRELPGGLHAFTLHEGSYETIWNGYAELFLDVAERGCEVTGPTRETGLVSAYHTPDSHSWVTEISVPIASTGGDEDGAGGDVARAGL